MRNRPNLPTIFWALFILILCGIPGRDIPHISFLEILSFDKWVHAGMFFVLTIFAIRGFRLQQKFPALKSKAIVFALAINIPYGGLLEIMQGTLFIERSADVLDFAANSFGCLLAVLLYNRISNLFPRLKLPLHV